MYLYLLFLASIAPLTQTIVIIPHDSESPADLLDPRSPSPIKNPDQGPHPIKPCQPNGYNCLRSSECCSGFCQAHLDSQWCTTWPAATPVATNGPIAQRDARPDPHPLALPVPAAQPNPGPEPAPEPVPEPALAPGGTCKPTNAACAKHTECCSGYCDASLPRGGRRCSSTSVLRPRSCDTPMTDGPIPNPEADIIQKRDPFPPGCRAAGVVCQIPDQCCSSLCEGIKGHKKCVDSELVRRDKEGEGEGSEQEGGGEDLPRGGWKEKRSGNGPHGTWAPSRHADGGDVVKEKGGNRRRDQTIPRGGWKAEAVDGDGQADSPKGSWR